MAGVLLLTTVAAGCYFRGVGTPRGSLRPKEARSFAYGGWIELKLASGERTSGELIAIDADSVFLLRQTRPDVASYSLMDIREAELVAYGPDTSMLGMWAMLGSVGTLSHGYHSILSLPVWILTGTLATGSAARAGRIKQKAPYLDWRQFAVWARFPQGLPRDLDRDGLNHAAGRPR